MTKLDLKYWNNDTQQWEASLAQGTDLEALSARVTQNKTEVDNEIREVVDFVDTEILKANVISVDLKEGANHVSSDLNTPSDITIFGKTMTNLFGKRGRGSDVSLFDVHNYFNITTQDGYINASLTYTGYVYPTLGINVSHLVSDDKFYVLRLEYSTPNLAFKLGLPNVDNSESVHDLWNGAFWGGRTLSTTNGFSSVYIKFTGVKKTVGIAGDSYHDSPVPFYIAVKNIALYEVDEITYNSLNDTGIDGEKLDILPYIEDTQSVTQPYVISESRNLLPKGDDAFYNKHWIDWVPDIPNRWDGDYLMVYNGATTQHGSGFEIKVVPNTTYTFSCDVPPESAFLWLTFNDSGAEHSFLQGHVTIKVQSSPLGIINCRFIIAGDSSTTRPAKLKNIQLTMGDVELPYVDNFKSDLYADVTLAQSGAARDSISKIDGKWILNKRVNTDTTPYSVLELPISTDVSDKVVGDISIGGPTDLLVSSGFTKTIADDGGVVITPLPSNGKYGITCDIDKVIMRYTSSIKGVLNEVVENQSHLINDVDIHEQAILELYIKIKALEV